MVRSSNSSTRRSSDSPGGAQYGIDVEESMVTDTGEEIHKHGPPVQYTPRGSVNVHSLTELQRTRMSSVGSSPEAPEYFNCIDTGTVYRFLVNDKDDTGAEEGNKRRRGRRAGGQRDVGRRRRLAVVDAQLGPQLDGGLILSSGGEILPEK